MQDCRWHLAFLRRIRQKQPKNATVSCISAPTKRPNFIEMQKRHEAVTCIYSLYQYFLHIYSYMCREGSKQKASPPPYSREALIIGTISGLRRCPLRHIAQSGQLIPSAVCCPMIQTVVVFSFVLRVLQAKKLRASSINENARSLPFWWDIRIKSRPHHCGIESDIALHANDNWVQALPAGGAFGVKSEPHHRGIGLGIALHSVDNWVQALPAGDPSESRTPDTMIKSHVLCHLS